MIIGKETEDPIDWYARRYAELAATNISLYQALKWLSEDVEGAEASGICLPNRGSALNAIGVLIKTGKNLPVSSDIKAPDINSDRNRYDNASS